ncbi:MAG TPA: D-glycerate dehydrogenase [Burkholderiales bacterium]|nr:D-glycerate dehydrogenase [Burkholderiales bacterium]
MKPKIAVTREVFQETLDRLSQHFDVSDNQTDKILTPTDLANLLHDKVGALTALTDPIDESLLLKCPRLKAVCNIAVGYNNIDVPACTKRRVMVTNTPGVLDATTADFAFALLLATARRVTEAEASLRRGEWERWKLKQFLGADVHGATLGIIGMGRIGQVVAHRSRGFDMRVIYHNRNRLDPATESAFNAGYADMETLLGTADFVLLMAPYSPATHHLIGAPQLALMKRSAIIINMARGGIVDDAALIVALKNRAIAGAGLDVYENEPQLNPEFLTLKNVVLTPHIGSSSEATRKKMAMTAAENLIAALTGGTPANLVNAPTSS